MNIIRKLGAIARRVLGVPVEAPQFLDGPLTDESEVRKGDEATIVKLGVDQIPAAVEAVVFDPPSHLLAVKARDERNGRSRWFARRGPRLCRLVGPPALSSAAPPYLTLMNNPVDTGVCLTVGVRAQGVAAKANG